jgi:hypothetical protein
MSENMKGYLYCMWNKAFLNYGKDVYKLGRTSNINNRMNSYATSYIDNCECKYVSARLFTNSMEAEKLLFFLLRKYRIKKSREFFSVELDMAINTIKRIEDMNDRIISVMYKKIIGNYLNERIINEIEKMEEYFCEDTYENELDEEKQSNNYFERFKYKRSNYLPNFSSYK